MGVGGVASSSGGSFRIIRALNLEWEQLAIGPEPSVARWAERHPALRGCSSLPEVLSAAHEDPDRVLGALLAEQRGGDQLAGRTVLQHLLGRIVVMALRDRSAAVDDYVGALWLGICTYPLARRPQRIAPNLALDALKRVKQELRWSGRDVIVSSVAPGGPLESVYDDAQERLTVDHNAEVGALTANDVVTAANRVGLIDGWTRAVLLSVYSDGLSGVDAADRHETSAGAIRSRCSRAVQHLAQHAALLAEVA